MIRELLRLLDEAGFYALRVLGLGMAIALIAWCAYGVWLAFVWVAFR